MHQIRQKNQNPAKEMQPDRRSRRRSTIAPTSGARPTSALVDRAAGSCQSRSSIAPLVGAVRSAIDDLGFLFSLSLSLFFRKSFEVKMRGVTDFRVKGEKIGQPEVIFRKMIFSVTAKHAEKGENDFLKSFSPKTNAPLVALTHFWASIFDSLYFH